MREQFEARMVRHLRAGFPGLTESLDDGKIHALIVSGVARAESYGIEYEADLQRFLEYMMVLSPDFDTAPRTAWAGSLLRQHGIDGSRKMSRIDNAYLFSHRLD